MFKIEYWAVIKLFYKKGFTQVQIKESLDCVYGKSSPSYTVKELENDLS